MKLKSQAFGGGPRAAGVAVAVSLLLTATGGGCTQNVPIGAWTGPSVAAGVDRKPWTYTPARGRPARGEMLTSAHFQVYTTLDNPETRYRLVQLLEAALVEYRKLAPTAGPITQPLQCYVFADRAQFEDFTWRTLGPEAKEYLKIQRGGYTIDNLFVGFQVADRAIWSVTGHEGFHLFSRQTFAGRLLPSIDEGLAMGFERVRWEGTGPGALPRFNTKVNPERVQALRAAVDEKDMLPLGDLLRMHAGNVVGGSQQRIDGFYAQCWALARFLQEYDNGKYLPAFRRMMADTAAGTLNDPTGWHTKRGPWNPYATRSILLDYVATDIVTLQREYNEYCNYLAREEFGRQWASQ